MKISHRTRHLVRQWHRGIRNGTTDELWLYFKYVESVLARRDAWLVQDLITREFIRRERLTRNATS